MWRALCVSSKCSSPIGRYAFGQFRCRVPHNPPLCANNPNLPLAKRNDYSRNTILDRVHSHENLDNSIRGAEAQTCSNDNMGRNLAESAPIYQKDLGLVSSDQSAAGNQF
jgi:hypothetical protein